MAVTNYITINGKIHGEVTGGVATGYATDALGSVVVTVDSSGSVANSYRYKPYGATLAKTGASADPKSQWVGSWGYRVTGRTQSESYVRARHYGQKIGAWTTVDPLWPEKCQYRYVFSNPNAFADYDGKGLLVPILIIGGVFIIGACIYAHYNGPGPCRKPTHGEQQVIDDCFKKMQACGLDPLLYYKPNLICNRMAQNMDAVAASESATDTFRLDFDDWIKNDAELRCSVIIHEALHSYCNAHYRNDDDQRHLVLDEWAVYLLSNCGGMPADICDSIARAESPPPEKPRKKWPKLPKKRPRNPQTPPDWDWEPPPHIVMPGEYDPKTKRWH